MAVRAVRGATQVDTDSREEILDASAELVAEVLEPAHVETNLPRAHIRHAYLRGAGALRTDLPR